MANQSHRLRSKRTLRLLVAFVVVLGLLACCKSCLNRILPDAKLDGEVFIVTRSGTSVKLGLVTIRLYSLTSLKAYFDSKTASATNEIARLEHLAGAAEAESDALSTNAAEMQAQATKLYREWVKTTPSRPLGPGEPFDEWAKAYIATLQSGADDHSGADDKYSKYRAAAKSADEARSGSLAARQRWRDLKSAQHYYDSTEFYFDSLPKPARSAKTDSDGKFEIRIPRSGPYFAVASASRLVGGSTEKYYWLVKVDPHREARIMLSNDNLIYGHVRPNQALNQP